MANATVEKLKTAGIRHGEKVAVVVVAALCLVMFGFAWSTPTIDMQPEQVKLAANNARQNLEKKQEPEKILEKIEEEGVTLPGFEQLVDARKPGSADPSPYRLPNLMVAPEPGAGLLRQAPELIAVSGLDAHPGRGAIRIFETDPFTGELVLAEPEEAKKGSRRNAPPGGGMMGPMMGPGMGPTGGRNSAKAKQDEERARRRQEEQAKRMLAGRGAPKDEAKEETVEEASFNADDYKKTVKGFRWVTVTGVLDHMRLRENLAKALKTDVSGTHPQYERAEVERQHRQADGEWSDWEAVDRERIENEVLGLLTARDPETSPTTDAPMIAEDAKLEALTDPLPYLEVGYWVGVHPGALVSAEALRKPEPTNRGMGGRGGMMGMMGEGMGGMPGGMGGPGMAGGMAGGMPGGMGMMGEGMGSMSDFGSMFGGGSLAGMEANFPKTEAEKVMVRVIDFTVEPDTIYRYRLRLVIRNPNLGSESVEPGVDTQSKELFGPWSDPTEPVQVPADVSTYVVDYAPAGADRRRDDLVQFEVVRWDPKTGVLLNKQFPSAPGQIVGEPSTASVPDLDAGQVRALQQDFTSFRLLVDTAGGNRPVDQLKVGLPQFDAPALALMLRPDGTLVLQDEAGDAIDGEMREMVAIAKQTREDVQDKKRKDSSVFDMMGGMRGMMEGGSMP